MAEITVKNVAGKKAGTVALDEAMFAIQPNVPVMHQVVTAQLATRRAGSHSTKTRSEVRGGGAKPYRQKGTGRARQGSTNSPQFSGGGIALGHPIGATGARLMTSLLNELERTGGRYGLQTMCEGGGQANVTIIERL